MSKKTTAKLKTPAEVRDDFERRGVTLADFARAHGLHYSTAYQVLHGQKKGRRGEAHRAAVLLGLKEGVIVSEAGAPHA